ncbi:putative multi-sensor hybrid histidine kinase [Magnetofaba australis IT-1]|uniref:histidine kinase n=1 Tax=Magnetofaba australis IT-1 TaxID=1434232 RepID=A0A1Y2K2I2_9PROT|nr:putative multi-sensor hybrid histidine kinase [Magnetofaba australis IT-1]
MQTTVWITLLACVLMTASQLGVFWLLEVIAFQIHDLWFNALVQSIGATVVAAPIGYLLARWSIGVGNRPLAWDILFKIGMLAFTLELCLALALGVWAAEWPVQRVTLVNAVVLALTCAPALGYWLLKSRERASLNAVTQDNQKRNALFLFLSFFTLAPLAAGAFALHHQDSARRIQLLLEQESQRAQVSGATLTQDLHGVVEDLLALSTWRGMRALTQETLPPKKLETLLQDLAAFLTHKPHYEQLRLMDLDGALRLAVNASGPYLLGGAKGHEQMAGKLEPEQLRMALPLRRGDVYLSPLRLNDKRADEATARANMRFITPVFDGENRKTGLLMIEFRADGLFDRLAQSKRLFLGALYLVSSRGEWLPASTLDESATPDPATRALAWSRMKAHWQGSFLHQGDGFVFARIASPLTLPGAGPRVYGDLGVGWPSWRLLSRISQAQLLESIGHQSHRSWYFSVGMAALLAVTAAWFVSGAIQRRRILSAKLRQAQNRLRQAQQISSLGAWDWDLTRDVAYWSDQMYVIFGRDPTRFAPKGEALLDQVCPEDRPRVAGAMATARHSLNGEFLTQHHILLPNGAKRLVRQSGRFIANEQGEAVWAVGATQDITAMVEMERALTTSMGRFEALAGMAPVGVFETDAQGGFLYVNDAWKRAASLNDHQASGDGWRDALHPLDRQWVVEAWEQAVADRKPFKAEYRFTNSHDDETWVAVEANPQFDESGNLRGFVGAFTDITEAKGVEHERLLAYQSQVVINQLLKLSLTRASMETLLQRALDQVLSHASFTLTDAGAIFLYEENGPHPDAPLTMVAQRNLEPQIKARCAHLEMGMCLCGIAAQTRALVHASHVDERHKVGFEQMRDHGHYCTPIQSGKELLGVLTLYLPAGRVRNAEETAFLETVCHSLAGLIQRRRLDEELESSSHHAAQANMAKSAFLANMSHEIRTPLNAMIGLSRLLGRTDLTPQQKAYLGKIDASAHSLSGVIDNILDFARIESGRMELEKSAFDLDLLLSQVTDILGQRCQDKGLELLVEVAGNTPRYLLGDVTRLKQVLLNLGGNAVKFTERGEVLVAVSAQSEGGDRHRIRFAIKDTGVGLTKTQLMRLLSDPPVDPNLESSEEGRKLGLRISRELTSLMGGQLQARSQPGQGAEFFFSIVCRAIDEQQASAPSPQSVALRGKRVLVVVEDASAREELLKQLGELALDSHGVATPEQALSELKRVINAPGEAPYELLCMDCRAPCEDGLMAVDRLRREAGLKQRLTVFLIASEEAAANAHLEAALHQAMEEDRLHAVLPRPVRNAALFGALERAFITRADTQSEALDAMADYPAPDRFAGVRALVVEDQPLNLEVAVEILQTVGVEVETAEHGAQALDKVFARRSDPYDVIFMDIQMPVMDGLASARAIHSQCPEIGTPIIAMTANAAEEDVRAALAAGMSAHLAKPIDVAELFAALEKWAKPKQQSWDQSV